MSPDAIPKSKRTLVPMAPFHLGRTVLLVEDEESIRHLVAQILEMHGLSVLPAASAEDALEFSRKFTGKIDLLLTDIHMGRSLTGFELSRRVLAERPAARVIFMSGFSGLPEVQEEVLEQRAVFLPKPFTALKLVQTVIAVLPSTPAGLGPEVSPGASPSPESSAPSALGDLLETGAT